MKKINIIYKVYSNDLNICLPVFRILGQGLEILCIFLLLKHCLVWIICFILMLILVELIDVFLLLLELNAFLVLLKLLFPHRKGEKAWGLKVLRGLQFWLFTLSISDSSQEAICLLWLAIS